MKRCAARQDEEEGCKATGQGEPSASGALADLGVLPNRARSQGGHGRRELCGRQERTKPLVEKLNSIPMRPIATLTNFPVVV
jgi:hypothetical protein